MLLMLNKTTVIMPINISGEWQLAGVDDNKATFQFNDREMEIELPFSDNERCFVETYKIDTGNEYSEASYLLPHINGDHIIQLRFVVDKGLTFAVADLHSGS